MRFPRAAALVAIVFLISSACTSDTPTVVPTPSPTASLADRTAKQVMQIALDAARAQSSFRIVSKGKTRGGALTFVNDVTSRRGKQGISGPGGQHAQIIVLEEVA